MYEVFVNDDASFPVRGGESILDAGRKSRIHFSYSCNDGRCGSCRCELVSGKTENLKPELALTEEEKSSNWMLSCCRTAKSDLVLRASVFDHIELPLPKIYPCRIDQIDCVATSVIRVYLRLPPDSGFEFIPGQYVDVIGPNGVRRSYTIASDRLDSNRIELHIRLYQDGVMSEFWGREARVGSLLRLNGPLGTFLLKDVRGKDVVFMATGTGIAGVKALLGALERLSSANAPRSVRVYWGLKREKDIYLSKDGLNGNFEFVPVLSRGNSSWSGVKGYVQDAVLNDFVDLSDVMVFACGSDAMIRSSRKILQGAGLQSQCFFSDSFLFSGSSVNSGDE